MIRSRLNWLFVTGYFIPIACGLCVVLFCFYSSWLRRAVVVYKRSPSCRLLDTPISLAVGTIRTPEFKVGETATYGIDIEAEGNLDVEKIQCLMGLAEDRWNRESQERYTNQCRGLPGLIDISWELMENGRAVEAAPSVLYRGDSHDYPLVTPGPSPVIRGIGMVRLFKGHSYSLILTVRRDASQLGPANPKLRVNCFVILSKRLSDGPIPSTSRLQEVSSD